MNPSRDVLMLILVSGLTLLATKSRGERGGGTEADATVLSTTNRLPLPDCPDHCGNLTIPFPFGTRDGCYLDDNFLITCNNTTNTATLRISAISVLNISLDGQLTVSFFVARDCYNEVGVRTDREDRWFGLKSFHLSSTRNKFIAIGCDTFAFVKAKGVSTNRFDAAAGCLSVCNDVNSVVNGSCSGIGCCQTSIPNGVTSFKLTASSYDRHSNITDFNPCSYAFIVKDGEYNFSSLHLSESFDPPGTNREFPMVLDWAIGNETCAQAQKNQTAYACKNNSLCVDSDNGPGYRCNCYEGYSGNPYIENGCQDVNECRYSDRHQCLSNDNCRNDNGSYTCFCPAGYHGDGRKGGLGCIANASSRKAALIAGLSLAFSALIVIISFSYCGMQRRKINNHKQELFKENGGLMLRQLLSKIERPQEGPEIFTEEQLKKATNNFSRSEIVGQGGYGIVYKGTLGNRLVAIKKSKIVDRAQTEQFINEVIVLSQINHPNVVKLIGCCLETSVPMLVYEFITNNTLHYHIHDESHAQPMRWRTRLQIAVETARALAYMHSDAPIHIIHRDIKSANILLDDNFTAKVSDFGASRLVPLNQTQLSTLVQGTIGYLDPEYFDSGLLTDKSDVYSFGVVLAELLTGAKVVSPHRVDNLVKIFKSAMKDDHLFEILDRRAKNEGQPVQVKMVADLALRCLRLMREERPTMNQVRRELEELLVDNNFNDGDAVHTEELQPLIASSTNFFDGCPSMDPDSLKNQAVLQLSSVASGR